MLGIWPMPGTWSTNQQMALQTFRIKTKKLFLEFVAFYKSHFPLNYLSCFIKIYLLFSQVVISYSFMVVLILLLFFPGHQQSMLKFIRHRDPDLRQLALELPNIIMLDKAHSTVRSYFMDSKSGRLGPTNIRLPPFLLRKSILLCFWFSSSNPQILYPPLMQWYMVLSGHIASLVLLLQPRLLCPSRLFTQPTGFWEKQQQIGNCHYQSRKYEIYRTNLLILI